MENSKSAETSAASTNHPLDCLNRENFLNLLDKVVRFAIGKDKTKCDYGVIGIDGEWGCGKSWILQEFTERHKSDYLIFHYNAWNNDYYEEPLVGILSSMVSEINSSKNIELLKKICRKKSFHHSLEKLKRVALDAISEIEIKGIRVGGIFGLFERIKKLGKIHFEDNCK